MAIENYEVQPLFAIPYFRASIGHAISNEQIAHIQNLKMVRNQSNLISEDLYIFEQPELASIKQAVHEALDVYADKVMGIDQQLYVTQSWSLINESNVGMHTHSHSNSVVSGSLYYCNLPTPPSNMVFDRHTMYQQLALPPASGKQNLYNTQGNIVKPNKSDVILFSSGIQHAVEVNLSTQPRYSIAFNCFVKGKLGDYRDVSELRL